MATVRRESVADACLGRPARLVSRPCHPTVTGGNYLFLRGLGVSTLRDWRRLGGIDSHPERTVWKWAANCGGAATKRSAARTNQSICRVKLQRSIAVGD